MTKEFEVDCSTSSEDAHNALSGVPIVNLVIDTGDFKYDANNPLSGDEQRVVHDRHIQNIKDTAAALHKAGVPTIYIAITNHNQIHDRWNQNTLSRLEMTEFTPQVGDIIFEKRFMSGFPTPEQLAKSDSLNKYVTGQRPTGNNDPAEAFIIGDNHTLTHLLRDAKHVIINGAMGQFCVTDNSVDAALQGKSVTILKDNIAVWTTMEGEYWKNSANIAINDPEFAGRQLQAMLDTLKKNPALRAIPQEEVGKLSNIGISTSREAIENLPALREIDNSKKLKGMMSVAVSSPYISPQNS